jgi:Domain of unknown function (DUF4399)
MVALETALGSCVVNYHAREEQRNIMPPLRIALLCVALLPAVVLAQARPTPKDAMIYIMYPEDGASVKGSFLCRFGLRNMGVAPAGHDFPNTGHHHLLIDTNEAINPDEPIPHDKNHLHFGAGETEVMLDLPPGKHTLQLVLGDGNHYSFTPALISKKITVTVRGDSDDDSDRVRTRSRHRSHHRTHRTHSDRHHAEPKPSKDGHEDCGFWGWLKGCQDAVSTPAKPAAPPSVSIPTASSPTP